MEAASGVADFRLIDPPRVSPQPVAPNRFLLLPLVLLASLAAGLAASFIYSQIRPTISDLRSLRELTGLPILGTVSMVISDEMKRLQKRDLVRFGGGVLGLVGSYGAALLLLFFLTARSA
jgi:uncharacterized protein involved in exopolysaccharide biosynthesis